MALTIDIMEAGTLTGQKNIAGDDGRFVAESHDPQLVFDLQKPLRRGLCRCRFEITGEAIVNPHLYIDIGHDFTELHRILLKPDPRNANLYKGEFFSPGPVTRLRLDPTERRSDVNLGKLFIDMSGTQRIDGLVAQVKTGAYLGRRALGVVRRNPMRLVRNWRQYVAYARGPAGLGRVSASGFLSALAARAPVTYARWIEQSDFDIEQDRLRIEAEIADLAEKPLISVVMPVYNPPPEFLAAAIESVQAQLYPHWQLCIADDASTDEKVRETLTRFAERDDRVKLVFRPRNGHICEATNSALELADGPWVALLDHDDLLRPHALAEAALEIARFPDAQILYSDEDKIDEKGQRYDPYFKPDFSRELFRSQNYLNHLTVHRADNIRAVGGWRPGYEGSQDYDLSLRILERIDPDTIRHIPKVLYHWRSLEGSTARSGSEKNYALDAGLKALEQHVARTGLAATVSVMPDLPYYRVSPTIAEPRPLVSVIIPTRDRVNLLKPCIDAIRAKTAYAPYEIIVVDNGSVEEETHTYFQELKDAGVARVVAYDGPFNFSAINNFAVSKASGSVLALVNNDIVVISPDWLDEMVSWAMLPDIGCVGAKLYYANDTIQHAGVILGIGGVAGHSHKYFPRDHPGYFSRLKLVQNLSAVTAACLVVRKAVYEEVGGLDAENLVIAFNDVDFCLKVRRAGYQNVFTPFAELYHLESVSRGQEDSLEKQQRFVQEGLIMQERWAADLAADPFYSPSLSLEHEDFSLRG